MLSDEYQVTEEEAERDVADFQGRFEISNWCKRYGNIFVGVSGINAVDNPDQGSPWLAV